MPESAPVTDFTDFLSKHGPDALEKIDESAPRERKADALRPVSPPSPTSLSDTDTAPPSPPAAREKDEAKEEIQLSLDEATLEALNLQNPAPAESGQASDGDTPDGIDLSQISKSLGFDRDLLSVRDGKIYVRTKVDGDIADKSIADLVKGYQLQEHTTRKSMDLAKEREEWEKRVQQQKTEFEQQAQLVYQVLQGEEREIGERYGKIDWDKVRVEDPAQYAALVADYNREIAAVRGKQHQVIAQAQATEMHRQEASQKQLAEIKEREFGALLGKLGWAKEEAEEKSKPIQQYLLGAPGYRAEELKQIFDHRFVVLADKARQWDELQSRIADIRAKKVNPKPVVPAGAASSQGAKASSKAQLREAQNRLADSGRMEDAAEVFKNIPGLLE